MNNNKQRQRDKAFRFTMNLCQLVKVNTLMDRMTHDSESLTKSQMQESVAVAELLTFIDALIDGFGHSPEVQKTVDACNARRFESLGKKRMG